MPRYFIEVAYKGTRYAGFQIQHNANTIQGEVEKAFSVLFPKQPSPKGEGQGVRGSFPSFREGVGVGLTCSSRTDAGVHALQNFFHFDWPEEFDQQKIYNLNAILPTDIVIKKIYRVAEDAHCRFDALNRTYNYRIYRYKNPFLTETAYFYPYPLGLDKLNEAASLLKTYSDFTSFSKRNTQVKTFLCNIMESSWVQKDGLIIYEVKANRFLRGMVRALTATMLKVGRGIISLDEFKNIIELKDCTKAYFDTPAHGLFLMEVSFLQSLVSHRTC